MFDTSKIDEWDLDTCVEYLMRDWEWRDASPDHKVSYVWRGCWHHKTKAFTSPHAPISRTLDEAAKLPEGWIVEMISYSIRKTGWYAECSLRGDDPMFMAGGETELLARFRLRCKVESVQQGKV